jgi:hypothetical protein
LLIAELETKVDQLKASETDLKNLFYREQEARQVLEYDYKELAYECDKHMELRIALDRDLINCYKSLQKLKRTARGCGLSSRNSRKPHSPSRGCWCLTLAVRR